jgi:TonB family protein
LPSGASSWPEDRIRVVLAHEMTHILRRDWLVQLGAECARALYWPNPLFWLACARIRIESEQACDDAVLGLGTPNTSYASHLVDLARTFRAHGRIWLPAPPMARPSTLERRIVAMLNSTIDRRPVSGLRKLLAAALLLAAATAVAAASEGAGAPSGVLRDPMGRVLPGATVRLSAIGADAIVETQTDPGGLFQFPEVADGDYMLSAHVPGFRGTRQRIRVAANMAALDVTVQVGTLREKVSVNGAGGGSAPGEQRTVVTSTAPSAPPACGSTQLGGNLKPPKKLKDVRPRYKGEWLSAGLQGDVLLQATIGVDGRVRDVEVVSPVNADLEDEAIAAVSQWEFSPTYLNCGAIEVRMYVTVSFTAGQ